MFKYICKLSQSFPFRTLKHKKKIQFSLIYKSIYIYKQNNIFSWNFNKLLMNFMEYNLIIILKKFDWHYIFPYKKIMIIFNFLYYTFKLFFFIHMTSFRHWNIIINYCPSVMQKYDYYCYCCFVIIDRNSVLEHKVNRVYVRFTHAEHNIFFV